MDGVSLGCCLLAFLLYYNTLDAGFVYDDRRAILSNPDLLPTTSWYNLLKNDFWGTSLSDAGSHGSYRPLCVFTFRLNYLLGGFQPWGYHLVNVLLHVLATGLVVRVARTVLPPGSGNIGPAVAGLLFASHPIHTEAVAGIVGRADLAACNFYLLSFLIYVLHIKYRDNICFKTIKINHHSNGVHGGMNTLSSNHHHCLCCDITKRHIIDNKKFRNNKNHKINKSDNIMSSTQTSSTSSSNCNTTSNKYHSFFVYLRNQVNQVTNVTTSNDFCCMKHNLMLSALSTFVTNNNNNNNHKPAHYLRQHNNSMRVNNNLFKIDNCEDSLRTHYHHHHLWYDEYDNNFSMSSMTSTNHNNNNNENSIRNNRLSCKCNNKQGTVCTIRVIKQWLAFITCVLCATAAVLSKETGISVLAVCALYDFIHSPVKVNHKKQLRSMILLGLSLFVLLGLRMHMASGITPTFATADNPTAKSTSVYTRFLTFSYLPTFNFNLLLCPTTLSFDWSMDAIPRINTIFDSRNIITLIFYTIFYKIIKIAFQKIRKQQIDYTNRKVQSHNQYSNNKYRRKMNNSEIFIDKYISVCQCPVCHHNITDHHSQTCRTNNNNNSLPSSHTMCICKTSLAISNSSTSNHIFPLLSSSKPTVIIREQQQYTSTSSTTTTSSLKDTTKIKNPYVTILMACAFLALPFLPATNIFFYVGFVVAERVLYLPSVGYCLLVGLAMSRVWRVKKYWRYTCACLTVLMILFCARTIRRNLDWRDEESLYRSAITVNPPKAYGNLGSVLSSQGRIAEAEWAYNKALEYRTNMADVHYNLGILLQGRKQYDAAIRSYQRAIHFRPSLALAYVNLGSALVAAGRCQEAVAILRQGSKLDGTGLKDRRTHETARVSALLQLGSLYADQGRLQRALAAYREALHTMPDHYPPQSVYNLLGETLTRLHQFEEAERWYQAALQVQPDHVPAHITYGKLLAKNVSNHSSRVVEAEQWFRRAQRLAPDDPSVYHHYGEFLASLQRHNEAAVQYTRAAELKPADYELVVAAATALRQADRRIDAEFWYRKAVQLRPLDARGHTNLGAILHLNGKYSEAAASYREALRLQPDDVTTLTNLHKLYSLMA